jgi:hypothetical protein
MKDPEVLTENRLPRLSGFDVYNAPYFPTGVTVNTSYTAHGFCGTPESLAIATRIPNDYTRALPGSSFGNVSTIEDADTELAVAFVQYVDHNLGRAVQRVALMYGTAIGNKLTGQIIGY